MEKSEDQSLQEILKRISEAPLLEVTTYHQSECVNQKLDPPDPDNALDENNKRIFDVINSYHVYCRLCQHHYYSCSKLNDINSFFQIHLNSTDHIWNRGSCDWDKTKPIFQWEKWLLTGFCEICNESGIEAFIADAQSNIVNIISCHSSSRGHWSKYKLLKEEPFHEIMAKLDLFSKIYIVKMFEGQYLCKVCGFEIKRAALLEYHLNSEHHCRRFCKFLKEELNVKITKRQRIKLDTEELAQMMRKLPIFNTDCVVINKEINPRLAFNAIYFSRNAEKEFLLESNVGFSPADLEKLSLADEDIRQSGYCALCQEKQRDMIYHLSSNSHKLRVMIFNQCSQVRPVSLFEYIENCPSPCREIEKYKKYRLLLQKKGLDFGIPFEPDYVYINFNSENCNNEPSFEAICDSIKCIEEGNLSTETTDDILQLDVSKTNEIKEGFISDPDEVKQETENFSFQRKSLKEKLKKKEEPKKRKLEYFLITTEKMSEKDISIVQSFIDIYSENVAIDVDRTEVRKLPVTPGEDAEGNCYHEAETAEIKQHCDDPYFIRAFEKWNNKDTSYFVCIVCGSSYKSVNEILPHLMRKEHISGIHLLKMGKLKPISPLGYSVKPERKRPYYCKKCGKSIKGLTRLIFAIPVAAKLIKKHEWQCFAAETVRDIVPVNGSKAEPLTSELKSIHMIGEESAKAESARDDTVSVNHAEALLENTRETDGKEPEKSRPGRIEEKVEKCVENAEESKVKNTETVRPDMGNGSPITAGTHKGNPEKRGPPVRKTKPKKNRRGKSAENQYAKDGCISKYNVNDFLKYYKEGLTEFLCAICLVNDTLSVVEDHLKSDSHVLNETYIRSKWIVELGFCKFCKLLILGTCDMFRQHYVSAYHASKESLSPGHETLREPLTHTTTKVLVVKGLPYMGKEVEHCIRFLLGSFGAIKRVSIKQQFCEVEFFNEHVVDNVLTVGSFMVKECSPLRFSSKNITQEVQVAMKSKEIFLMGQNKMKFFVSYLVEKAESMMTSPVEKQKEEYLCDSLQKVLQCIYPNCKCFKFGSRVTGLIVGDCDLDVFVDYGNQYYSNNTDYIEIQRNFVKYVSAALEVSKQFSNVIGIKHCRVPIVSCLHRRTGIHCDISFRNGLSCENTNLIKFMISLDDRVKGVILFLKYWTKSNDLHGRPNFSSYALTMLIFFYLQQEPNPVLPTVEFLKSHYRGQEKVIGGWDCGFATDKELVPKTKNSDSVVELILGFFNFCNSFNFSENVISPLTGEKLSRQLINKPENGLPVPYKNYASKINSKNYSRGEQICIMDPFDLNHNLTKAFPQISFKRFLYLCRLSANLLSNSLQSKYFFHLYEKSQM